MTFTIVGRCQDTGHHGICMATSSPAVGNRCSFVSRDGSVAFQAIAEPRLGAFGLKLLEEGRSPSRTIAELCASDDWPHLRQIGIVDRDGRSAGFTGDGNLDWAGHRIGPGYVAMGNVLAGEQVVAAIEESFVKSAGDPIEERLLAAIEAGRDAGGQEEGQYSASLLTFGSESFSRCDLRVDLSKEPEAELRRIYDWYRPLIPYFEERPSNPKIGRYKDWLTERGHKWQL